MITQKYQFLEKVNTPDELKELSQEELRTYCNELRRYIIEACSEQYQPPGSTHH